MSDTQNKLPLALAAIAVAALVVLAFFGVRHLQQLNEQLSALGTQVGDLGSQVSEAEKRAADAEAKAAAAEERAGRAATEARTAAEQGQESAAQARAAAEGRLLAEKKETESRLERDAAKAEAEAAARAKAEAEAERLKKEEELEKTLGELDDARMETMEARAEARRLKRRMEAELDRLQAALGRIAETRRTALGLVMTLDSDQIEFDFDKDTLRPENREVLSKIAGILLTFEDYAVQIFGHTDDVGSEAYNKDLSKRRADTVKSYLVEAGIDGEILSTLGMGESSPRVEGTDEASRQRNRRVELAIVFSEGEYEAIQPDSESPEP